MQEAVQEKALDRPAHAGQVKTSSGAAAAPFVDNRPSSAAQLKLANMAHSAPKVVAQRRQMNVITGDTVQREEEDEPLQAMPMPLQRVEEEEPVQGKGMPAQLLEDEEPAQAKADAATQLYSATMQLQSDPVRQYAFRRTWGDEEPEEAVAAPQQAPAATAAAAAAPGKKPGFFERMKNGVKSIAGSVGRTLLNWSGQGQKPAAAAANAGQPGPQPAPQSPAGPKVYTPNEKRQSARRIPSRAPVANRNAGVVANRDKMLANMRGSAAPQSIPAAVKAANAAKAANVPAAAGANAAAAGAANAAPLAANAAPAAANAAPAAAAADPAAAAARKESFVASVVEGRMRGSASSLMKQGLSTKVGALAAAEEPAVAGKLTAANYAVSGESFSGANYAGAAASAAKSAAKANGAG
jgi:hypothetical protein